MVELKIQEFLATDTKHCSDEQVESFTELFKAFHEKVMKINDEILHWNLEKNFSRFQGIKKNKNKVPFVQLA